MNILFIDNFDSFTYNLVDEFEKRGHGVQVFRNNVDMQLIEEYVTKNTIDLLVIPPGPSSPDEAGICVDLIKKYKDQLPILGVCLGHQSITVAFGGKVDRSKQTVHGKSSVIKHDGKGIFKDLENPISVARYHSLCATEVPDTFEISATSDDKTVMAMRNKTLPIVGIQFHPESILTPSGGKMIENLLNAYL